MTLQFQETFEDGNVKTALFEDKFARNETGTPLELLSTVLVAVSGDVFLGNAKHHGSNFRPDASTGAHSTRFVGGIQDEIR